MGFQLHIRSTKIHFARRLLSLIVALMLLLNLTGWGMQTASAASDGMIRVKLSRLGSPSSITFKTSGSYSVVGERIASGSTLKVTLSSGSLTLSSDGKTLATGTTITVARTDKGTGCGVRFTSPSLANLFCGDLTFKVNGSSIQTVLRIYVETYLYGVVPYEMSNSFPLEALKAQAVSARTYAMRAKRSGGTYDLTDNTNSQVFKGYTSAYSTAIRAVDETRGVCLMYGGAYAQCYYTASNGGQTESARNVWGGNVGYLTVKDDPYDLENPSSLVKSAALAKEGASLSAALSSTIKRAASLDEAEIVRINSAELHTPRYAAPSRTYTKLRLNVTFKTADGEQTKTVDLSTYGGLETTLALSINSSNNEIISLSETDEAFVLSFRRYGHGVGLSQRGAQWMASAYGKSYSDILDFYYPGTTQTTLSLSESLLASETPTPTSTPVPVETEDGYTTLQEGDSGEAVKALQTKLKELGFFTGTPLGNYKSLTVAAVRAYQAKNGLTVDGVASPALQKRLFEETLPGETPAPSATPAPEDEKEDKKTLQYGDSGEEIKAIQRKLKELGYFSGNIGGNYLKLTEAAVKAFQTANGLTADGIATPEVQQMILSATTAAPTPTPTVQPTTQEKTAYVKLSNTSSRLNIRASGSTSSKVVGTLTHGQKVTVTGTSGSWSSISAGTLKGYVMTKYLSEEMASQPEETPAPSATPAPEEEKEDKKTLQYGDSGEEIKAIQRKLKELGYFSGNIGGNYLKLTEAAVKAFQTANGLTADGIATPEVQQLILSTTAETGEGNATIRVNGNYLNVRAAASTSSERIGRLYNGDRVTVLSSENGWYRIEYDSQTGYVIQSAVVKD